MFLFLSILRCFLPFAVEALHILNFRFYHRFYQVLSILFQLSLPLHCIKDDCKDLP